MLCSGSCCDGGVCGCGGVGGVVVVAVVGTALVMVADTPIFNIHEKNNFLLFQFFLQKFVLI